MYSTVPKRIVLEAILLREGVSILLDHGHGLHLPRYLFASLKFVSDRIIVYDIE